MDATKIERILNHYEPEAQTVKAIEELAELQAELSRLLLKQGDIEAMKSELADVVIMTSQLMYIFNVDPEELDEIVAFKLDRQLQRMGEEQV